MIRKILIVIFTIIFLVSGGILANYYYKNYKSDKDLKVLKEKSFAELQAENPDLVAWVTVPDSKIDYPVMQTKNDPEYYLRKDFEKKYSLAGTPFLDATSDLEKPTNNWMIYGHNIKSGIMFTDLVKYEKEDYFKSHEYFYIETAKGKKKYKVISVLVSEIYPVESTKFKYYEYPAISSRGEYEEYVRGITANSLYKNDIPKYPKQLVTLSTCAYHVEDGRIAVIGMEVE